MFIFLLLSCALCWHGCMADRTFCTDLKQGSYCTLGNSRELMICPIGLRTLCPSTHTCEDSFTDSGMNQARCLLDPSNPVVEFCARLNRPIGNSTDADGIISRCLDPSTIIECPRGRQYTCPADLQCTHRGLRAYCETPKSTQNRGDASSLTNCGDGLEGEWICDPVNLRRMNKCGSAEFTVCPPASICSVVPGSESGLIRAGCIEWTRNLRQFCRNKPIYSSYCIPPSNSTEPMGMLGDAVGDELILCGDIPTVLACPSALPRCYQRLGITAQCFEK